MRPYLLAVPLFMTCATISYADDIDYDDDYEIQESGCDGEEVCLPPEERSYSRRYYCPHRYSNYYDYRIQDTDASWPGKNEYSFMEEMMR